MNYIPYKIKLYLPLSEDVKRYLGGKSIMIFPCDSKKFNKRTREKLKEYYSRYFGLEPSEFNSLRWEDIELLNSGIEVSFYDQKEHEYFYIMNTSTIMKINHPELEKRYKGVDFIAPLENDKLLGLIKESGYMSERKIHGSFCCRYDTSITTYYGNVTLEIENPDNLTLSVEKDSGKLLYDTRKTRRWEPGNVYILSKGTRLLYLGIIHNKLQITERLSARYNITKGQYLVSRVDSYNMDVESDKKESTYHLYINLDEFFEKLDKEILNKILVYRGKELSVFLKALPTILNNQNGSNVLTALMYYKTIPLGAFSEKFLVCPEEEELTENIFNEFFLDLFRNSYNGIGINFAHWLEYDKLTDPEKAAIDSSYKKYVTNYSSFTGSAEEIIQNLLKPSTPSYYYGYTRSFRNILYVVGKERFKTYLTK